MRHTKKQEGIAHTHAGEGKKRQSGETVPEEGQVLGLTTKTLDILNMVKEITKTMSTELNKNVRIMFQQIENVNKKTEIIKRNQVKNLEIKRTINQRKFHYKSSTADLRSQN